MCWGCFWRKEREKKDQCLALQEKRKELKMDTLPFRFFFFVFFVSALETGSSQARRRWLADATHMRHGRPGGGRRGNEKGRPKSHKAHGNGFSFRLILEFRTEVDLADNIDSGQTANREHTPGLFGRWVSGNDNQPSSCSSWSHLAFPPAAHLNLQRASRPFRKCS